MSLTLVILAAGLGARFGSGGKKQVETVGPFGETISDYSAYDAFNAGFSKVVFVIKKEHEKIFCEKVIERIARKHNVDYAFQDSLGRDKPWGTGHAVLCAKDKLDGGFAVINADDFYGRSTFAKLYFSLGADMEDTRRAMENIHYMVGFMLKNTVTEHGFVSRGICRVRDRRLTFIDETHNIRADETGVYTISPLTGEKRAMGDRIVSMNAWGFRSCAIAVIERGFGLFYENNKASEEAEYYLPAAVAEMIAAGHEVAVIESSEKWYGITYKQDVPVITSAINKMIKDGVYPEKLWE